MELQHSPADVAAIEEIVTLYGLYGCKSLVVSLLEVCTEAYHHQHTATGSVELSVLE